MPNKFFLIPLFDILGLLGFTYSTALSDSQVVRYLPFVVAAGLVIWLAISNRKNLISARQIVAASVLVSLVFVACFEVLGFLLPGLAKDIDAFSIANLIRLSVIAVISIIGHTALFAAIRYFHRD